MTVSARIWTGKHITLEKINKREARKRYIRGEEIHICPCKVNPLSMYWSDGVILRVWESPKLFDSIITEFEYYNCQLRETGYYAAYYVEVK